MKRFFLFCFPVMLVVMGVSCCSINLKSLFNKEELSTTSLCGLVDLGFIEEKTQTLNYKEYIKNNQVVGECVQLKANLNLLNKICDKIGLMITDKYCVGDIEVIEGVSNMLPYKTNANDFNVQIALNDETLIIGSPIIYGSY